MLSIRILTFRSPHVRYLSRQRDLEKILRSLPKGTLRGNPLRHAIPSHSIENKDNTSSISNKDNTSSISNKDQFLTVSPYYQQHTINKLTVFYNPIANSSKLFHPAIIRGKFCIITEYLLYFYSLTLLILMYDVWSSFIRMLIQYTYVHIVYTYSKLIYIYIL
jgi:hypothetical protein